jgi:hypothetical protein
MAQRYGQPALTGNLMSIKTIGGPATSRMASNASWGREDEKEERDYQRQREKEAQEARTRQEDIQTFMAAMGGQPSLGQIATQAGSEFMSGGDSIGPGPRETFTQGEGMRAQYGNIDLRQLGGLQSPQAQSDARQFAMNQAQEASQPAVPTKGVMQPQGSTFIDPVSGRVIRDADPVRQTPSQGISQKQLDRMNILEGKVADGTATERESTQLDKMYGSVSPVQINFGRSTGSERSAIAGTEANIDALDNLEKAYNQQGVESGPLVGRLNPITGLAGFTSDNQENFMAASASLKNRVIQEITGAQMSEAEVERIEGEIPLVTDPPGRWKAKFAQTRKNLKLIQKRRRQVLLKSGITDPLTGQQGQRGGGSQQFNSVSNEDLLRMIGGQ